MGFSETIRALRRKGCSDSTNPFGGRGLEHAKDAVSSKMGIGREWGMGSLSEDRYFHERIQSETLWGDTPRSLKIFQVREG